MADLTREHVAFLSRFTGRGWVHATREDEAEQQAIDLALRKRWLRRERGEARFTQSGRIAITRLSGAQP